MKTTVIHTRISDDLKVHLDNLSRANGKSVSKIIRNAIKKYIHDADNYIVSDLDKTFLEEEYNLLQSLRFAEFIFWLYDKRDSPGIDEDDDFYEEFIELINEMRSHPSFNDDILYEFDKIRRELKECIAENTINDGYFSFPEDGNFDYEKLTWFMYCIRYDKDNNKVLFIR